MSGAPVSAAPVAPPARAEHAPGEVEVRTEPLGGSALARAALAGTLEARTGIPVAPV